MFHVPFVLAKVFTILYMLGLGICLQHHIATVIIVGLDFGTSAEIMGGCHTKTMSMCGN